MSNENAPVRDKERSIKYSYSVPSEDWATEMFFRELEFGSPELLDIEYYRALRSATREKADPSERVPRLDLVTLLDDSRSIRNAPKAVNVHVKRKSYMEAIANDPGTMYDFNIYEETLAKEEEEARIVKELEQARQREEEQAQNVPEPPAEEIINVKVPSEHEPEKPPEPVQEVFLGALVPLDTWKAIQANVSKVDSILREAIRDKEWYELIPTTVKETREFRMFDYLYTRKYLTDEELEWASSLYDVSLSRLSVFLDVHKTTLPDSKTIRKAVEHLVNKRRARIVKIDLQFIREQDKAKKKLAKKVSWRLKNA